MSDVQRSAREIHLPQTLNEEATADEFSDWEQVSSVAAERFAHRQSRLPPAPFLFRPHSTSHPPVQFPFYPLHRYPKRVILIPTKHNADPEKGFTGGLAL